MEFSTGRGSDVQAVVDLFQDVFSASEGADEGVLIGAFVQDLLSMTPEADVKIYTAYQDMELVGAVAFSRITYPQDSRDVFILSPMAVRTDRQKSGIGQALITFGLDQLRNSGVDVVLTYGDPNYYCKTGFLAISEESAQPPLRLSYPHGWLGQSLDGRELTPLKGPSHCVAALNNPALW
ncbi:N-acetyltransferase [Ruegeria sp. SCPT10]|uniref:GNAT family N-acetyltransferase n=1 Tax=Ruegeria sp. SCP10 TaxID=3141377 RepID=UPI00333D26B0